MLPWRRSSSSAAGTAARRAVLARCFVYLYILHYRNLAETILKEGARCRRARAAGAQRGVVTMALANCSLAALRHENALLHQREHTLESQLRALTGGEPASTSLHGARRRLAETDTSFTKERVTTIAVDKKLLLTFVNIVRIDFARTWVHHVRRLGMTNWLVGATDPRALRLAPGSTPTLTLTLTLTPHPDPNPKANPNPSPSPSREP